MPFAQKPWFVTRFCNGMFMISIVLSCADRDGSLLSFTLESYNHLSLSGLQLTIKWLHHWLFFQRVYRCFYYVSVKYMPDIYCLSPFLDNIYPLAFIFSVYYAPFTLAFSFVTHHNSKQVSLLKIWLYDQGFYAFFLCSSTTRFDDRMKPSYLELTIGTGAWISIPFYTSV